MVKISKIFLLLFFLLLNYNMNILYSAQKPAIKISHYNADVEIFPAEHKFVAQVEIKIVNVDTFQQNDQINFSLNATKIHWVKDNNGHDIKFNYAKKKNIPGQLQIVPQKRSFDTLIVAVRYEGVSLGTISSYIEEKNSYLLFESDWYPQLSNFKENIYFFTYNLNIIVAQNQAAISSGELEKIILTEGKKCYCWRMTHPTFAMTISSAEYEKQEYKFDELSITTYLYPEHKHHKRLAGNDVQECPGIFC